MSAQHTPGPWKVFSWPQNNPDEDDNWCYRMEIKSRQNTFAEHEVNARIMSAAPEMLAALKRVEATLVALGARGEPLRSIHAAIAKAEGKS